jgi:hypothetical protein
MDTLDDRLAELADDAPTGGAPAAELWARGKRAHRLRAAALAATLLVVGAVGTGIGVRLVDGDGNRSGPAPAGTVGIALPIEYPVGEELPDLGDTPGPLAAIWLAPRVGGGAPEAVGLVAETGTFGTLPIDLSYSFYEAPDAYFALSPDGRRIAYEAPMGGLVVRDLVSGENYSPVFEFEYRAGYTWVDATHLVGHVAGGSDVDGWVWEPGTAPKLVDLRTYPGSPWLGSQAGRDPWFTIEVDEDGPRPCSSPSSPTLQHTDVPLLCDALGVIGSEIVLTHWNSEVVALDRADFPFEDPALRHVVATAGGPQRVTFATDLIGEALDADGGAS